MYAPEVSVSRRPRVRDRQDRDVDRDELALHDAKPTSVLIHEHLTHRVRSCQEVGLCALTQRVLRGLHEGGHHMATEDRSPPSEPGSPRASFTSRSTSSTRPVHRDRRPPGRAHRAPRGRRQRHRARREGAAGAFRFARKLVAKLDDGEQRDASPAPSALLGGAVKSAREPKREQLAAPN